MNIVVTTIQPPTAALKNLAHRAASLIVVGDAKGPAMFPLKADPWPLDRQLAMPLTLPAKLPLNHYSRKNVGYLVAIQNRAACIYETDDDNEPLASWRPREQKVVAQSATAVPRWVNVYRHFTPKRIWPRGLPLAEIESDPEAFQRIEEVVAPIQQGLANGNPDVDAVWRLGTGAPKIKFQRMPALALPRGVYSPFNSQSTWWWPDAYPLLYLPSHCSFRMTDIWRSFIAQKCLWEMGGRVVFHAPEVVQERNPHNIGKDFDDELAGYQLNAKIRLVLETVFLGCNTAENLRACYAALHKHNIFPKEELDLLDCWLADIDTVTRA